MTLPIEKTLFLRTLGRYSLEFCIVKVAQVCH